MMTRGASAAEMTKVQEELLAKVEKTVTRVEIVQGVAGTGTRTTMTLTTAVVTRAIRRILRKKKTTRTSRALRRKDHPSRPMFTRPSPRQNPSRSPKLNPEGGN